jgi:hypothetical protein
MVLPSARELLSDLELTEKGLEIQLAQTEFRREIVKAWGIPSGWNVLEVGCGQGDMSLVLGAAVGSRGSVTAVDPDAGKSGAPITFIEAAANIHRSPYSSTVTFLYDTDVLEPSINLPLARYDCAVLAHSAWYFASPDQLRLTFARLSDWTDRLYISEWDLRPKEPGQTAHFMAVLFQGAMATFESSPHWNVQSLLSPDDMMELVEKAGWTVDERISVDSTGLQDGTWEVANCVELAAQQFHSRGLLRGLAMPEINPWVKQLARRSLDSFVLRCRR